VFASRFSKLICFKFEANRCIAVMRRKVLVQIIYNNKGHGMLTRYQILCFYAVNGFWDGSEL
jgi:hypothetical protein